MSQESLMLPLLNLITTSTNTMRDELQSAHLPEPWLATAEFHPWDLETPPLKYWNARRDLVAALGMMLSLVQNPKERIISDATSYQTSAALNLVCKARIPDILAEASAVNGIPVEQLAKKSGVNAIKLDRLMRFLCTHHIFEERAPAVFANNRISRAMRQDSDARNFPIFWSGVLSSGSNLLPSVLLDPTTKDSFAPTASAFALANRKDKSQDPFEPNVQTITLFEFMAQPNNQELVAAFGGGMGGIDNINGKGGYLDFDWSRFDTPGGFVVDVGSGVGHLALNILPAFQHSQIINQDRPEVCETGAAFIKANAPTAHKSGKITFKPLDFFIESPVKGANAYILSNVIHDWDKEKSLKILSNVKKAMTSNSRILILEVIINPMLAQHAQPQNKRNSSNGTAPYPLLADWGIVNRYAQMQGMEIMGAMNSIDRTRAEFEALFKDADLEIVKIHKIRKLVSIVELKKC